MGGANRRPHGAPPSPLAAAPPPRQRGASEKVETDGKNAERLSPQKTGGAGESHIRDEEVYGMAAFRIRETAHRIETLANSARDDGLRRDLILVCERLIAEEIALLARMRR
jgi:hypothetical protein